MKLSRKYVLFIFKFWKSEIKKIKTEKKQITATTTTTNKEEKRKKKYSP